MTLTEKTFLERAYEEDDMTSIFSGSEFNWRSRLQLLLDMKPTSPIWRAVIDVKT